MPCIYHESPEEIAARKKAHESQRDSYKQELDRVTNLLCRVMRGLQDSTPMETDDFYLAMLTRNKDLATWWERHKRMDAERKNQLIFEAKRKLNKEEREALGLE
jgi:hypothetical protein